MQSYHPTLTVAWYKNGLPGIGALLINQADPIIVVQHLGHVMGVWWTWVCR